MVAGGTLAQADEYIDSMDWQLANDARMSSNRYTSSTEDDNLDLYSLCNNVERDAKLHDGTLMHKLW